MTDLGIFVTSAALVFLIGLFLLLLIAPAWEHFRWSRGRRGRGGRYMP